MPLPSAKQPPARIQIQDVRPQVDCGRYPVKGTQGDPVEVAATIFKDGHDILRAVVRYRHAGTRKWLERPLEPVGNDRWRGTLRAAGARALAVHDRGLGRPLRDAARRARPEARGRPERPHRRAERGRGCSSAPASSRTGTRPRPRSARRTGTARSSLARPLEVDVERERARFGAWYELFPRSWGGFKGVEKVLPQLAELGFDVLYLPPVHPIGTTNRKGRNNALVGRSRAIPGSPWAIGGPEGGHDAIHPELGTLKDFDRLVAAARKHGLEIALDFAIQCSPDHPWLKAASGVVQPAAGRDAQVRREPAQALPGHLQRQLRLRGLARPLGGAAGRRPALVPARRPRLPRRQPAHEVGAVLGVADRARCAPSSPTRSSSPRRSRGRR